MYRPIPSKSERAGTLTAVVLIHAALAYAFLNLSGAMREREAQEDMQLIDLVREPPPPVEEIEVELQAAPEEEGEASPPNIESEATPVIDPQPRIALPVPTPMPVSPTPNEGHEPTQGAAPVPGPGTGAGGVGTGLGAGGSGSGRGGDDGDYVEGPRLLTPVLRGRDFPRGLLDQWPRNTPAFLRLRIDANGDVLQCIVDRGAGVPAIDAALCRLVETRFRFRPALNRYGQAVAGWTGYVQPPPR